jgi:hypothetical protein
VNELGIGGGHARAEGSWCARTGKNRNVRRLDEGFALAIPARPHTLCAPRARAFGAFPLR